MQGKDPGRGPEPRSPDVLERLALPQGGVAIDHWHAPRAGVHEFSHRVGPGRYELLVTLFRGRAVVRTDERTVHDGPVFPGMLRLVPPGDEVRGSVDAKLEAIGLDLPARLVRRKVRRASGGQWPGERLHLRSFQPPDLRAEQLGRLVLRTGELDPLHAQLVVDGTADSLLALLLHHHGRAASDGTPRAARLRPDQIRRALEFAEARLDQPLGLETWADALGLPAHEFSRRFRATTGSAPYAWFLRRRIDRAKELLSGTDAPLSSIALDVGFSSQSHFTEAFSKREGVSPARWRRNHA